MSSTLFELAEAACLKRPTDRDAERPPRKKVRFACVETTQNADKRQPTTSNNRTVSPPQQLGKLIEKVRRRAERRNQRRSLRSPPPPPLAAADAPAATRIDTGAMQHKLQRMEQLIKDTARAELELMNKAKRMQEKRALLTRKYETSAQQLREMQQSQQQTEIFQIGVLPPLMVHHALRRVSREKIVVNMASM